MVPQKGMLGGFGATLSAREWHTPGDIRAVHAVLVATVRLC